MSTMTDGSSFDSRLEPLSLRFGPINRVARRVLSQPHRRWDPPLPEVDGRVLHPGIAFVLRARDRAGQISLPDDAAAMRTELSRLSRLAMPRVNGVYATDRMIPVRDDRVQVRVYRPFGLIDTAPGLVFFHGGGWVTGDLESHDGVCRVLSLTARCVVVAVDYRRAPEHPFPIPFHDCRDAFAFVQAHADEFGIDPARVGVAGDSAGGNLAAAVSLRCREESAAMPVVQGLVYPAVDMEFTFASHDSLGHGFGLDRATMTWFRTQYCPDPELWLDPCVAPIRAQDHSGLPPAVIATAGFDPLRDDGFEYARRLEAANNPPWFRCYDNFIHGFFGMGVLPEGMAAIQEVAIAIGRRLHHD